MPGPKQGRGRRALFLQFLFGLLPVLFRMVLPGTLLGVNLERPFGNVIVSRRGGWGRSGGTRNISDWLGRYHLRRFGLLGR
jgi:hypothetical protein